MAQKYYNVQEAAQVLGVNEEEVKQMLANREIHGYRDGADWKFRAEQIDEIGRRRAADAQKPDDQGEDEGDVLLSEVELGGSDAGASGTVIGMEKVGPPRAEGDIELASEPPGGADEIGSKVTGFETLDLNLEEDLSLEGPDEISAGETAAGGSDIGLVDSELEDDDLVLGGSGTGSDITIGGDSGISLVDPTDSGLSLDEPLDLAGSAESLELGEDDMISLSGEAQAKAPGAVKPDDDFLLTPLEEATDEESESGSQVIALDTEGPAEESATMLSAGASAGAMAAMLDEDLSSQPAPSGVGLGAPLEPGGMSLAAMQMQPAALAQGVPVGSAAAAAALPEAPYSVWNVVSLVLCALLLALCGMFMYDLLRNMWSWGSAYPVNSPIMDTIVSWFGD